VERDTGDRTSDILIHKNNKDKHHFNWPSHFSLKKIRLFSSILSLLLRNRIGIFHAHIAFLSLCWSLLLLRACMPVSYMNRKNGCQRENTWQHSEGHRHPPSPLFFSESGSTPQYPHLPAEEELLEELLHIYVLVNS